MTWQGCPVSIHDRMNLFLPLALTSVTRADPACWRPANLSQLAWAFSLPMLDRIRVSTYWKTRQIIGCSLTALHHSTGLNSTGLDFILRTVWRPRNLKYSLLRSRYHRR